jgi:hypothetical protein
MEGALPWETLEILREGWEEIIRKRQADLQS